MITEWFMSIGLSIAQWFLGLFGDDPAPDWLTGFSGFIADMFDRVSGLGAWFPFVIFGAAVAANFSLWIVLWSVKGIRWLWGLTPFSGGS